MYIILDEMNRVQQIIPDFDPNFPDIPISQRFSSSFISSLIYIEDNNTEIKEGMIQQEDGSFSFEELIPVSYDNIEEAKTDKIVKSKTALQNWFINNPYLYSDGKYYSCTEEKQALLNGNLASYERAAKMGIEYPLKWNSTGEECTEWNYTNLLTLSLKIAEYVAPRVSAQQALELKIKACETIEEVEAIKIKYE